MLMCYGVGRQYGAANSGVMKAYTGAGDNRELRAMEGYWIVLQDSKGTEDNGV